MSRLVLALLTLFAWLLVTVAPSIPGLLTGTPGGEVDILALISSHFGWGFLAAALLLLAIARLAGWKDLGLNRWPGRRVLRFTWLPVLYILFFLSVSVASGLPTAAVAGMLLVNCLLVGLSEELMFRGVLFRALYLRLPVWGAIWIASLVFGAVHSLNALITGDLPAALVQSANAVLSGVLFTAVLLRTGSLWPAILLHGLWDFSLFMAMASSAALTPPEAAPGGLALLVPMILVLPNGIFGFYLLRHAGRDHPRPGRG